MPIVRYNAFKAPEQIYVKDKERISYEYDAFESRATMYYGNTDAEKQKRRYVKHYNHDGTMKKLLNPMNIFGIIFMKITANDGRALLLYSSFLCKGYA